MCSVARELQNLLLFRSVFRQEPPFASRVPWPPCAFNFPPSFQRQESPAKACDGCHQSGGNLKKCTRCYSVSYCGKQCQQMHWPTHKHTCSAASAADVTTRSTAVQQEAPRGSEKCCVCGKSDVSVKKCGRCKSVAYCGTDCQRKDWSQHKTVCRMRWRWV